MRRSIATVSLSGTLPEKLEAIAAARFDGVEIFEPDLTGFPGRPRDIRDMAADLGLTIELFQPFRNAEGLEPAAFQRALRRLERKLDLMEELGAPLMLVCSNVEPDAIDDDGLAAEQLRAMAERAGGRGIRLGYEALAWGTHVSTFDHAWRLVERADHPHLGLILDSFHTLALPHDWSGIADLPGERIFFVQLADAPRLDMATLMLSRHHRCLPGQGELNVGGFTEAVLRAGYTGPLSLEIFNDALRSAPTRQTAKDGMRSLLHVEEQVRRVEAARRILSDGVAETKSVATAPRRVELFDPPTPARLDGVAFVEFAVNHAAQAKLADELKRLGFRRLGRHRSKDVDLYGMGDIRFVLNAEPHSTAHSYYLLHGASVCAIAYEVDDPLRAVGRAEAFGCPRFEGRVGPNELSLPGIRSIGGELVYFTRRRLDGSIDFETDFLLDDGGAAQPDTAHRIDHIAQVLPEGALDAAVLFHRAVLDLEPEPVVVLADPFGLVRSRAISDQRRRVRFPLNIASGRNTSAAKSVSTYLGAGVHHIALETSDLFAAAERLRANGVAILPIPANYYDDLAARFDLDEDLLTTMTRLNILYDRQGDGEFFQLYTQPFEGRFFFELVERRGGYDQYGAANASIRMAASSQLGAHDTLVG
jgi:4-hydroxyphenylpyruvate dioxygenase